MTDPARREPLQRCWFCDQRILRDDVTRVAPGLGLVVHSRCYESAIAPSPPESDST